MSRGKKTHFSDANLEELLKDLNWGKSSFENRFKRFCDAYGFEYEGYNMFKKDPEDPNSEYEFSWQWYPLLQCLLKTLPLHPFFRANTQEQNITTTTITQYYEILLDEIELLPNHLKYEIMSHPAYQSALKEKFASKHLADKIAEFISAISIITNQERPDIMIELIRKLDEWIYSAFKNNYSLSMARQSFHEHNADLINEMIDRDNERKPSSRLDNENVRQEAHTSEKNKRVYFNQSQLDSLLALILDRQLVQDKLPKPKSNMTPKEKSMRRKKQEHIKEKKELVYLDIGQLLKTLDEYELNIKNDDEFFSFREAYNLYLQKSSQFTENYMNQIDTIVANIKQCKYLNNTAEEKIKAVKKTFETMTTEQKETAKQQYIANRRAELQTIIERCQKEISALDTEDSPMYEISRNQKQADIEYVRFCETVREHSSQFAPASQSFLGQLIAPAFHFSNDKPKDL
ncbi:hypothetical protein PV433_11900 [Paenibacillus sp. GYB004]|uniref:hypothetical protein n=1 Tax=Paenibacillus sp. GYB004 TaxID=2994393 RepID=UPI002F968B76